MTTLQVLTVCTHNRTRSVLMKAILGEQLSLRGVAARLNSAGTFDHNQPPTEPTVRLLAKRGINVAPHRSSFVDDSAVADADLIVTAEREHVVFISGRWDGSFSRTFTLPELVIRGEAVGTRGDASISDWLELVNHDRPRGMDYLNDDSVAEIVDPTGQAPAVWRDTIDEIDLLSRRLALLLLTRR